MNKFRNLAITALGMIMLIVVVSALIPSTGHGQGGNTVRDVNVVNTPSVNVINPVGLTTGTTVGINPSNNTVKLDATNPVTVRGEETEIIYNQVITAQCCPPSLSAIVEVSAYKQIRIAVTRESGNNSYVLITPFLHFGNEENPNYSDRVPLDDAYENSMNKVYDTPGQLVRVQLQGSGNVRVVIYGRRN
jgi:hypothetical protein